MKKFIIIQVLVLVLFGSCRKDDLKLPDDEGAVTPAMARDSLWNIMNEWYYWYKDMPQVNKNDYADPYELIDAMRYTEFDRWSYVEDYDKFLAEMNGVFVGHGYRFGMDDSGNARIAMIYPTSQLYKLGVRRGWIIKKINDTEIAPILLSGDIEAYNQIVGPPIPGRINTFDFVKPDGSSVRIADTKTQFNINSVIHFDTLHLSSGITGHLVLESFIVPTVQELNSAFAAFKAFGVTDLILDLRYNSGGYLYIANTLASYIAGNSYSGTVFAKTQYNDRHEEENGFYKYTSTSFPLNLTRLAVITTRATASASEAVMNGLSTIMDVVSIGDTTNGKPSGMNGWSVGEKYYFWPVTFMLMNSNDEGDFFNGIEPSKVVTDDITHDFNDKNEYCLKEAIHYLETGSVSTKGSGEYMRGKYKRYPTFFEKPSWREKGLLIGDDL